ncbi:hypothetical protein [Daejeonella sp.]|jgi:hypothetical protein|uniref:hypothetical protein n=1 Tax=Daejeonella sp. TaxID=2805397 RepID=UPI0037839D7D
MFSDYKVQVLDFYKKMREQGLLPLHLINPTAAKLKKECILIFQSRSTKGDIGILRQFFGHREEDLGYLKAIKTIDTDKFKPLVNFLKEQTQDTEDKNIELLAWLIDFNPRPYQFSLEAKKLPKGEIITITNESAFKSESIILLGFDISIPLKHWYQKRNLRLIPIFLIALISIFVFNQFMGSNSFLSFGGNKNQCMYWAKDRYVSKNCDEKMPQVQIIALDESKLRYFKKITRPDTLKITNISGVWYSKINKVIELYTSPGNHPVHTEKQLKPLSKYMFNKYILNEQNRRLINTN